MAMDDAWYLQLNGSSVRHVPRQLAGHGEEAGEGEPEEEAAAEGAERGAAAEGEALHHRGLHHPARLRLLQQTTKAYVCISIRTMQYVRT